MGVSTSLYSGLSGLKAHQRRMDVIGNNVANVNTPGFRSSRVLFRTAFAQTLSIGTAPSGNMGGVNPKQIGLGTSVGATSTNFGQGSIETTGITSDLAVSGEGFFVLRDSSGRPYYTRDGSFSLAADQILTNSKGMRVQGWMADENFQIAQTGAVGSIEIPIGSMRLAMATQNVHLTGNLNSSGTLGTQGSLLGTQGLIDNATGLAATAGTLLTDLTDAGGIPFFGVGDVLTLNADKGGRNLPQETFTVAGGMTLGGLSPATSLAAWTEAVLGINTTAGVPGTPGVTINAGTGALTMEGNYGLANDISDLVISSSGAIARPFTVTKSQSADGESGFTPFIVYDSLGNELDVAMAFVLESMASTGNTWRWYAESTDDTDITRAAGTGTMTFDTEGQYISGSGDQIVIDRDLTGARTPLTITPNLEMVTQLASDTNEVALTLQDGTPEGTLNEYSIGADGVISGIFTNGMVASLAQIALATFANNGGLFAVGDNLFSPGPNAGTAQIGTPGAFGAGTLVSGALEQSNVDLANEFVNLIVTQTGYTANSRVISSSNDMLTELLNTIR
ncbi:MAG: flagellar hook protein FlgE [Planctomycetota bacterium]